MELTDADFSGWATKTGLKCTDGRTIMPGAFEHQDNVRVPLVRQHTHNNPKNVLGHAILQNRPDGVYTHAFFNDTPEGLHVKKLVQHGDVVSLSIFANQLKERSKQVFHGMIREVSVVLSGANPGALIENVRLQHSDESIEFLDEEAVITTGLELEHRSTETEAADTEDVVEHADQGKTLAEVLESMNEEQTLALNFVVGAALQEQADKSAAHSNITPFEDAVSEDETTQEGDLAHQEGLPTMNVFDQNGASAAGATLSHDQFSAIVSDVRNHNGSLQASLLAHAGEYGIDNIEFLFPDAKAMEQNPQLHARRMEWVAKVLDGTKHTPFAKVKSIVADLTADEARAKGYVKGTRKMEEVFSLLKRSTGPTTIYKKQKLDRDQVVDITDMDVVGFLKAEMRIMLEEEIARAILVGDGRSAMNPDKIKDPAGAIDGDGLRSILHDSDFYAIKATLDANVGAKDTVKGLVRARSSYRGTGKPTLFCSDAWLTDVMLEEDKFGRPLYETEQVLADKLRVSGITTVDLFDDYEDLLAIMVNLADYSIGANKGGELTSFEDFDIDFNQMKYLQEARLSGGLTKPFSAIVVKRALGTLSAPTGPSFNGTTNTITVPVVAGVVYEINDVVVTGDVVITETSEITAAPAEGFYFAPNVTRSWTYTP